MKIAASIAAAGGLDDIIYCYIEQQAAFPNGI